MIEKNHIGENETTIENATTTLRKQEHTDDVHRLSSVYPCWKFDWFERSYECSRCSKRAKLFWHPEVHKHRDYATVEEIEHKSIKNNLSSHPEYVRRMVGY
jgi:hypothetical protein